MVFFLYTFSVEAFSDTDSSSKSCGSDCSCRDSGSSYDSSENTEYDVDSSSSHKVSAKDHSSDSSSVVDIEVNFKSSILF